MNPTLIEKNSEAGKLEIGTFMSKVDPYLTPNLPLYVADLTCSVVLGNVCLLFAANARPLSFAQAALVLIAATALFRATAFMHEVFHQNTKVKWLISYYNFLHGFLHKIPSVCHDTHKYHHSPATYGTIRDPEYDALGEKSAAYNLLTPFLKMIGLPIFLILRFGIIPFALPLMGGRGRLWVYVNMTTLAMTPTYKRPVPEPAERKEWYFQDFFCGVYSLGTIALFAFNVLSWKVIPLWFVMFYLIAVVNFFRALLNHRYFTGLEPTSHKMQILDSVTLPASMLTIFACPVGLNYHALHHMIPHIPYHNLGKVHKLLLKELPPDHPYHITVVDGYLSGLMQFLRKRF
jgi:fatty acid desaturase